MGKTLCRSAGDRRQGWSAAALAFGKTARRVIAVLLASVALAEIANPALNAQSTAIQSVPSGNVRLDGGRFTVVASETDKRLAQSLLASAQANDTFPGLPRPRARVLIGVAPSAEVFRAWTGPGAPEWGAAIAMPELQRIIMHGSAGNSSAGDPLVVLRHELAHLALHEALGNLPQRWFDEGYASFAAGEWDRTTAIETSVALMWRAMPEAVELDAEFGGGASRAGYAYALSHLAVSEMAGIDERRGLANFFAYWKETGSYERAVRQAFGMTTAGFDDYWHSRVRRRYGALALMANLSLAFGFVAVLIGPAYFTKRRRNRLRLEGMRAAEAAHEARIRQSALEAMMAEQAAVAEDAANAEKRDAPAGG